MAMPLAPDALWERIEPLLPPESPKRTGGRPRVPDRAGLASIIVVRKTGIPWEMLPQEMGCGRGMACWRRLRDWHKAGVWTRLHHVLLDELGRANQIDWERACVDSASAPANKGGQQPVLTRRIMGRRGPSGIWCATDEGRHSRPA